MKEFLDPKSLGAESRLDIGILFLAAGIGGLLDAIWNVATFAEPIAFATICGPAALGLKKFIEGLLEQRSGPPR